MDILLFAIYASSFLASSEHMHVERPNMAGEVPLIYLNRGV